MEAEGRGEPSRARARFQQAWDQHTTTIEAAVAAHYLARHQDTDSHALHWNQRALDAALASDPASVEVMMPSLHLNLGRSHETVGQHGLARRHYEQASAASGVLGDDGYSRMPRNGIAVALDRVAALADRPS